MSTRGATQRSSAPFNRRIVLDIIRRHGQISRRDIIDLVALSPQTVANITQDLEALGLIVSVRMRGEKARGQPPMAYSLNPSGGDSIGLSLQPGGVSAALVNLVGEIIHRTEREIDAQDQDATGAALVELIGDLARRSSDAHRVWGVGAALPGPWNVPGMSFVGPTAFEGWSDLTIFDRVHHATGLPVFHNTDSVAGALGEVLFGSAQALDSFYYLHFGVGLGGTLVINRTAFTGEMGNATELGHIPIVPHGKPCYCGSYGCLERYLSLHSLSEFMGLPAGHELDRSQINALMDCDDAKLADWCAQAATHLRSAICVVENMLDPTTIIIGGTAPSRLLERILALAHPLRPSVRAGATGLPRVSISSLQEESSLLGAAVLPIHEMLSPRFDIMLNERKQRLDMESLLGGTSSARRSQASI